MIKIEPSILDIDASKLNFKKIEKYVERVHIDVVPKGKYTPTAVKRIRTELEKDVHLMILDVEKNIIPYKNAGASIINFNVMSENVIEKIKKIRKAGMKVGLAINPETHVNVLLPFIKKIDEVLVMSVHPGKGGQRFINISSKIKKIKQMNPDVLIKVDGGIKESTLRKIKNADVAIIGSYIFNKKKPIEVIKKLSLKHVANNVRKDIIKMINKASSGHPGGALGMADVFTTLYFDELKYDVNNVKWDKRDYLVLSNGHICTALYSCLARVGFFSRSELEGFRKTGRMLEGHPSVHIPGIENGSGPLGIGLSQAAGMALGSSNRVFCVVSDGEQDEGNNWEAVMLAAKYKLGNLITIMDRNKIQLSGNTKEVMELKNLKKKYLTFGWNVRSINGNNLKQIKKSLQYKGKKPLMIIANTTPGKGVSFMEGKYEWHGKAPNDKEAMKALEELDESR
ncbi:hypothetical protein HN592_04820 [Candidatus Woesearchaeota archaeon]|jgi:transketolase|nr:hypothetical protein [Candidatus Woesearchaeota archaeon]MBT4368536.1 hypothetical protein [Candidatus Woesearchaeota archaeon]MBT4713025.1 hypothetical protein [Candidatus Woesearchaeota archaeon]MBT6639937.1 hypothetical protein [Candidatus Woesearchaeota archaeon]MBT7134109.1 hypothetical protein [Candidatus Woesearchaeota archaeon]